MCDNARSKKCDRVDTEKYFFLQMCLCESDDAQNFPSKNQCEKIDAKYKTESRLKCVKNSFWLTPAFLWRAVK